MSGNTRITPDDLQRSVGRGLEHLRSSQLPSGEFQSFATPLGCDPEWTADSSVFVTSLCILALGRLQSPTAAPMIERARGLLRSEASHGPLWRFWTHDHDRHLEIPCDADDSACATMALSGPTRDGVRTRKLLLSNRDRAGRFHTWFIPRGVRSLHPLSLWTTIDEWRARERRELFWEMTEATPNDVDVVVNANVLRCFGRESPSSAVEYVSNVVRDGIERVSDSWHRNEFSCWFSIADGFRRGVPYDDSIPSLIARRVGERVDDELDQLTALDAAHALASLISLEAAGEHRERLARHLVCTQLDDGSWPRSIFFYGGPKEVFAWGSEDLSTAAAIASLAEFAASAWG